MCVCFALVCPRSFLFSAVVLSACLRFLAATCSRLLSQHFGKSSACLCVAQFAFCCATRYRTNVLLCGCRYLPFVSFSATFFFIVALRGRLSPRSSLALRTFVHINWFSRCPLISLVRYLAYVMQSFFVLSDRNASFCAIIVVLQLIYYVGHLLLAAVSAVISLCDFSRLSAAGVFRTLSVRLMLVHMLHTLLCCIT